MTETKMKWKRSRAPLLVLATLLTATLVGRAVMHSNGRVDDGLRHFTAPGGGGVSFAGRSSSLKRKSAMVSMSHRYPRISS